MNLTGFRLFQYLDHHLGRMRTYVNEKKKLHVLIGNLLITANANANANDHNVTRLVIAMVIVT